MHQTPARYLVVIDASGGMVARLFDAQHIQVAEFDASSEEVAVMATGLQPVRGALGPEWARALSGHSEGERRQAEVYTLDI